MSQLTFSDGDELSVVRGVINGNGNDVDGRLEDLVVFRTTADVLAASTDEGDSGNARGLTSGAYIFNNDLDMGALHFVLVDDATYTIRTKNVNTITYTGTLPFITSAASTPALVLVTIDIQFLCANATAIDLDTAGSLIMRLTIFVGCLKAVNYTDSSFMTIRGSAMVLCADGITCTNVSTMQINTLQWSDGPNSGGTGLQCVGTCDRLILSAVDARPTSNEFFIDIDATYTGTVSITGGTFSNVGTFFKGSRDAKDPSIISGNVVHVKSSTADAFGHVASNSTETVISTINTPVILDAVWTDVDKARFTFSSTGRWTYTGLEDICVKVSFIATIDPVGGGSRDVSTYIALNGTVDNNTQGSATLSAGGQVSSIGILDLITGDFVEPFIENNSGTQNLVGTTCSFVIG